MSVGPIHHGGHADCAWFVSACFQELFLRNEGNKVQFHNYIFLTGLISIKTRYSVFVKKVISDPANSLIDSLLVEQR